MPSWCEARPTVQLLCKLMYKRTALVGETEAERLKEHLRDRCTRVKHLTGALFAASVFRPSLPANLLGARTAPA